jgi:soluble lytic murein transglycosylase-like protein
MTKTAISLIALFCAAPALASSLGEVRLKSTGKIVISNDTKSIRATRIENDRRTTLVELAATRPEPLPLLSAARRAGPSALAAIFEEAARVHSLDPLLLTAVARQESRFQIRAVSPVGARGIMQLMPRTAAALGVTDSFDARQNIHGGARYLRTLLDEFGGDLDLCLAAYNAGPGAVRKYRGVPPYRETTAYVAAIRRDYETARREE